jgi:hypothetical protein
VFTLGRWGWPVSIGAAVYLALMLINIVDPSGLTSPRGALFNFDWITLVVVLVLLIVGALYFFAARPDRRLATAPTEEAQLPTDDAPSASLDADPRP